MDEGLDIGSIFCDRRALSDAGLHSDWHRRIDFGAASVVVNGLYVDDEDYGDEIIVTGEGGRDERTGRQRKPQTLTGRNHQLAEHVETGEPVRVIRGSDANTRYAPETGYRYDGLYRVTRCQDDIGLDGYRIFRFRLEAIPGESKTFNEIAEPPWTYPPGREKARRVELTTSRVVRDTRIGRRVKELYDYRCQICGARIETPDGTYAEACHIRPIGSPHHGPDRLENVLCLCPNHHVLFDYHAIHISDDFVVVETGERVTVVEGHEVGRDFLAYHRGP
jgi:putative restriction endonuclease